MRPRSLLALALLLGGSARAVPEQVHLGVPSADPSGALSVLWVDAAPLGEAVVELRGPAGAQRVEGRLVPGPSAGAVYEATLPVEPGWAYEYALGGRTFAFRAPPRALGPEGFVLVALGDMAANERSRRTLEAIQALDPALVLHAGDVSYAHGDPLAWKAWFDLVEPVAATRPWVVALGNHETYTGNTPATAPPPASLGPAGEVALFRQRFGLPGDELTYSFAWQGVHVVAIDTFSRDTASDEGRRPLAQDEVARVDRELAAGAGAAWSIVVLHEPAYSSNAHGSSARVQQALVPLFERHGVDLVIQAHDHAYERTLPMRGGAPVGGRDGADVLEGTGVVYVTTGGGGHSLYDAWAEPAPAWSAARAPVYHVLALRVGPEAIEGRAVPTAGDAFADGFRIVKPPAAQPDAERPAPALPAVAVLAAAALALARPRARGGR